MHPLPKVWDSQFQEVNSNKEAKLGISHYSPCEVVVSATPEAQDWSLTVTPEQCPFSDWDKAAHLLEVFLGVEEGLR